MKLLKKSDVNVLAGIEKKKQIDEGVKIATKIDVLRETLVNEEANFEKFRVNSLATLKAEIAPLAKEKENLVSEVEELKKTRQELLAPVDLTQAWERVTKLNEQVENSKIDVLTRETSILGREENARSKEKDLSKREIKVKEAEETANTHLLDAENLKESAEVIRDNALTYKSEVEQEVEERYSTLKTKEANFEVKVRELSIAQDKVKAKEKELRIKEIQLIDREGTLARNIKRLK